MSLIKQQTANGLKWSAIERIATQAIQLIVMLILGRMLGPEAFGLVGMLAIFIAISQTFVDSGFSSALIRKQDRSETDYATTFYFNIVVSLSCYVLLFIFSPYIADFYHQPELINLTRVLGIVILANAFAVVQRTRLTVVMDFKTQAKASLLSVSCSTIIALVLAYCNFGVWALVGQTLSFAIINVILLNIFDPWLPKCGFSKASFKELFGFGSKLLASAILATIYENIYQIIIGKLFNAGQLGLFTQAKNLSSMPAMTLTGIIQRVTYPMMSQIQNDQQALDKAYLLTLRLAAVVISPIIIGLGLVAKPLLTVLLGQEWQSAAELMSILCIGYMLYPIHAINLNLLQVKGRSDLFLKLEIIKKIIVTLVLVITVPFGIKAICIGMAIQSYLALFINTYYTGKLSSLTMLKQFKALISIWLLTLGCAAIASLWYLIIRNDIVQLGLIIISALSLYFIVIKYLQSDLFDYIINTIFRKSN
ncbi:oligosaccharide flippase family protein [Photobacterium carnosum]|uniref:lipopolysaccharide biosynthesis protein n=1 Tax=Photobacterium carnosum TaxID=2023717 RepID=UPI001E6175A4|nr:lipopolysaccharide biosynthesis protein [Photobacterium carnosum]MCD9547788.1 oligosaccharide flippase family protein [Photobacterium carnosum]MCF2305627.1 oligosaccharide flippase family protein [Photobacterium carnosum]